MTHFKSNAYILVILALFLSSLPIANSQRDIPVTYRAEYIPFGKGLTWKEAIPSGGGALGLEVEFVFSPGTVTAEVAGEIRFSEDTRTIAIQGTGGQLKSDGGVVLKGDIVMNFTVPLPEAFFQEDDDPHINYRVPIPGLNINKGWNESEAFNSLLLNSSRPESVKLDIRIPQLVTIQLSAVEIVPVVASAILSGGTLTTAVKIFVNNLSDYLDAGISLYGGIASELTLAGKTITLNGATITHENRLIRAPDFDPSEETYQIQSGYDEEFTYTLDIVASSNAYAKVTVLGGIEIWSYDQPFAEKRVPIIPKNTFDLNFGGAATSATIDAPPEPLNAEAGPGVIPDPALADSIRRKLNIRPDDPITRNDMRKLTELWLVNRGVRNLTGFEHAINLTKLDLSDNAISEVSLADMPNLESLKLYSNALSKVSLSGMSSLIHLDLSDNALSEISLPDMPNLELLGLSNNTLSEVSLPDMPNLEYLSLFNNTLSEISLPDMPNLEYLNLSNNVLSEVSLPDMPNLRYLGLVDNALSEVSLPDIPNLEHLGLGNNVLSEVSLPDMPNLEYLSLFNNTLSEVSLPDMPNLESLSLSGNNLSKVSLSDMPNLTRLYLEDNPTSKLSLSELPSLTELYLPIRSPGRLEKVSLSGLPNLKVDSLFLGITLSKLSMSGFANMMALYLRGCSISEISLSDMPNLTQLYLSDNAISDVSGLSDLKNLESLDLSNNAVSDVSPLTEFPNLTELYLPNNPVNFASRRTYIPAMQARGVFVWFDERVSPILVKISGEDQIGAPGLALPTPFVVQALDVEDKPMSGIPIKFAVAQGRGELSTTTVRTDATGKAQTTLTLGPNPGTNTVAVIAEAFEKAVSFTATAVVNAVTPLRIAEDVNGDGIVNIQDLVLVSSHLGEVGENAADVNGDGVVNIQDLVKVSAALQ